MNTTPHFLLFSGTKQQPAEHGQQGGSWYFQLESTANGQHLEASDAEVDASAERLELLAVVRGLEALDQPSRVTLMTSSPEVSQAIRHGLPRWRAAGWTSEQWGRQVPIRDRDLWQRIDRAARIHRVDCKCFRFDGAHGHPLASARGTSATRRSARRIRGTMRRWAYLPLHVLALLGRALAESLHRIADWLQRVLPDNSPTPHPMM